MSTSLPKRLVGLDALRGVAILLVLGYHQPLGRDRADFDPLFATWEQVGWAGVDLFFVLSGFLIGRLLLSDHAATGHLRVGRFYRRRLWKIWPPYFAFLAAVAAAWLWERSPLVWQMWPNLMHAQNYIDVTPSRIAHTWSLAVEEHFYLLLPLLLSALTPARYAQLPLWAAGIAVAALAARIATAAVDPNGGSYVHHFPTHLRIDSLMAGVALAYLTTVSSFVSAAKRVTVLLPVLGVACFSVAVFVPLTNGAYLGGFGFTILASGGCCLVLWTALCEDAFAASRIARGLAAIGVASYGIYLWHMPFAHRLTEMLSSRTDLPWHGKFLAYLLLAIGMGTVMTILVERPSLVFREQWEKREPCDRLSAGISSFREPGA